MAWNYTYVIGSNNRIWPSEASASFARQPPQFPAEPRAWHNRAKRLPGIRPVALTGLKIQTQDRSGCMVQNTTFQAKAERALAKQGSWEGEALEETLFLLSLLVANKDNVSAWPAY